MVQIRESAMLILQEGSGAGRRWPLSQGRLTIGRGEECEVLLPDRHVSRYHARISWMEEGYCVEDLESKNGISNVAIKSQSLDEKKKQIKFKITFDYKNFTK